MTPDEIYDTLTKLLQCMMCDGEWDDDRCRECECYLGENWNMFPFLWAVRGFVGDMKWIPVTETLPPSDEWVLATVKYPDGRTSVHRLTCVKTFTTLWEDETMKNYPVTAWMKMPEPWEGNTENQI